MQYVLSALPTASASVGTGQVGLPPSTSNPPMSTITSNRIVSVSSNRDNFEQIHNPPLPPHLPSRQQEYNSKNLNQPQQKQKDHQQLGHPNGQQEHQHNPNQNRGSHSQDSSVHTQQHHQPQLTTDRGSHEQPHKPNQRKKQRT